MKKATKLFLVTTLSLTASVMMSSCDVTSVKDGFGGFVDSAISSWAGEDASNAIKDGFNGIVDTVGGWFGAEPENPEVKVTVTFDSVGGSAVESQEFTVGAAYALPTPTKDGYTFGGWKNGNVAVELNGEWTIAEDVTLTATWTAIQYTITYEGMEGVENSNPTTYTVEDEDITLVNPNKTGYEFKGWKLGDDVVTVIDTDTKSAITLTATWDAKTFTLTVNKNDGSADPTDEITVTYNEEYTIPQPTNGDYTFAGWVDSQGNSFSASDVWTLETDVTVTARWTTGIAFDFNGAENAPQEAYSLTIEEGDAWNWSENTVINAPVKAGYTFKGWYVGGDKVDLVGTAWTYGKVTLKAEWEAITYTITYENLKGQTAPTTVSYTVADQNFTLATLADVAGYTFKGWKDENGTAVTIVVTNEKKNLTLTAVWDVIEYEIEVVFVCVNSGETLDANKITGAPKGTYTIEDEINLGVLRYENDLYDFIGYFDAEEDGNEITKIEKGNTGKITLYARFEMSTTVGWTGFY